MSLFLSDLLMPGVTGKTELAKQVARYMHKDIKKVCHIEPYSHTLVLMFSQYV